MNNNASAILQTATAIQEKVVDDELKFYDSLLSDDSALERLRAKRLQSMQQAANAQRKYRDAGHGSYDELQTSQQDARDVAETFFAATKTSERLVVHFYRPTSEYCDVYHKLLNELAPKHMETRFMKINVQDCAEKAVMFLVDRLKIRVMPTVVLIHKRQVVHQLLGFDEVPGGAEATPSQLAKALYEHKMVEWRDEFSNDDDAEGGAYGVNAIHLRTGRNGALNQDYEAY